MLGGGGVPLPPSSQMRPKQAPCQSAQLAWPSSPGQAGGQQRQKQQRAGGAGVAVVQRSKCQICQQRRRAAAGTKQSNGGVPRPAAGRDPLQVNGGMGNLHHARMLPKANQPPVVGFPSQREIGQLLRGHLRRVFIMQFTHNLGP